MLYVISLYKSIKVDSVFPSVGMVCSLGGGQCPGQGFLGGVRQVASTQEGDPEASIIN